MNASDGDLSDLDAKESQATQLIQAALEKLPEPSERQGRNASSNNSVISIDSSPSAKNSGVNSGFQYHFHGLAGTQTGTQLNDDENEGDSGFTAKTQGSQKENFATASEKPGKDINQDMSSASSRPYSPHGLSIKDNVTIDGRAGGQGRTSKMSKSQLPAVTPLSPIKTPIPRQQTPHLITEKLVPPQPSHQRANRSCSPTLSEDSFARGDTQLREEQYLVTSKKFTIPLVDLVRSDDDDLLIESSHRAQSVETTSFPRTVVRDEKDEPPPIVLVPSTPSQSEGSDYSKDENLWKSPQDEDSLKRGRNISRMVLDSESGKGSQYSQGFDGQEEVAEVEGLYSGARTERSLPAHKDVSRGAQSATQIVTHEEPSVPETLNMTPQTNSSTYTHTGVRSLLNHMDPSKRGRYQHLLRPSPTSPESLVPRQLSGRGLEKTVNCTEPRPSIFSELQVPSNSGMTSVQIPSRKPSPKKPASHQILSVDTMDIVPDSEPMQEQVQSSVLENPASRLDRAGFRIRTGGVQRLPNDSEATEGSNALTMLKKSAPGEEEEEEEGGSANEKGGRDSVGSEYDPDRVANDDDDDDEPLFSRLHKGKRYPVTTVRKKHPGPTHIYTFKSKAKRPRPIAEIRQPARQQRGQQGSKDSTTGIGDTPHESAVPSSVPDQDHSLVYFRKPKAATAAQEKDTKGQGSRAISVPRSSRSARSTTTKVDDGRDLEMEVVYENERVTETVLDSASEEEEYLEPEAARHSLKRKRRRPPKSQSMNQVSTTPQTRTTKRLKSACSTISKTGATRVFALWKQNKLWYSGIVYEHVSANAYMVKFDDDHEAVVSTEYMRTNDLRVGDLVRFGKGNKDIQVTKVNNQSNTAAIEGELDMLEFKDIGISTKVINSTWQDRLIDPRSVVAAVRDIDVKAKSTPSPSRSATSLRSLSTNAKGPRQTHKFLQKAGLIVSLGSNTNDRTEDGKSRSDILRAVRDSGGVVVDDLFKYLKMDILFSTHRWIIERDSVQWIGEPKELQRLFLIADNYNLKPKYLMALALGIPCLSIKWLYACLEASKELDWRPYLLPQGRPTILYSVLPSQQVDLCWGEIPEHLFNIMENPVASRLLEGQSVLCAGPDMTPRGKDVDKASFIVRIILAMGAKRVEAVRDISHAANPLSQYNLLILREKEQYTRDCVKTHTVDWNWIKDSLIMSRRLNYPIWSVDEGSQCSQTL